jgi:hypothetical protein
MTVRHTPGPWLAMPDRFGRQRQRLAPAVVINTDDWRKGHLVATVNTADSREMQANARLIAAAPDMIELIRRGIEGWTIEDLRAAIDIVSEILGEDYSQFLEGAKVGVTP